MRRGGKALVFALVLATGGVAGAQEDRDEEADEPEEAEPEPEEEAEPAEADQAPAAEAEPGPATTYQGVAPGEGAPAGRKPRHGRNPTVTWLGFQPQPGGGARVFVQLDREVPHAQQVVGGELIISLERARVAHKNTRRHLDTRFFDTAVDRVAIEPARRRPGRSRRAARGLELVIRFKDPAGARSLAAAMSAAKDGFTYLIVDVPAGGRAAAAPARRR
jgi:colicin import membrane protein